MTLKPKALGGLLAAAVVLAGSLTIAAPASAATLTEITNFGANPSNLRMHLYVPDQVAPRPAVLLAVHYCTGSGPAFYSGTEFASLADRHGFIVIYPSATRDGSCFDVSSPAALRHDGGSDPVGLVSMVRYVLERHNGDPDRVFVTGLSSGAMMTNVLLGDYPDMFSGGAAFAGVPFACFATTDGSMWNNACAQGQLIRSPQEWGNLVRGAFPGYSGPRPRMQLWHGTADDTLRYPNFGEEIKQWTDVHGLSQTPAFTDSPQPGWTRTRYGGTGGMAPVEAVSIQNGSHNILLTGMAAQVIRFFGLDSTTPPTSPPPTTPPPVGGADCQVTASVNAWNTGLVANLTITNTGGAAINGWSLAFTLAGGQTITSGWSASYSPASGQVTAQNAGYNATIGPNQSVTIGFQATHTGNSAGPGTFALNGATCATS
jgi:poly(hydroxyalkanoate) depolymerase family esterase